ncbi:DgyrCDS12311 [Dimorphilus gyrociliatus]|nr:DgyrCDS12311 [Dimorphilus gyrociliatus]
MSKGVNDVGLSRKHIMHSIECSLKRLETDFVDLYQLHMWDSATSVEQVLRTMNDLIRRGLIRQIGVSNATGWQLQKICDYSRFMGLEGAISIQNQYNLLTRAGEYEITDVCENENVSILAFAPLKGGWLNCRIKRNQLPPTDSRVAWVEQDPSNRAAISNVSHSTLADKDVTWRVLDTVQDIANAKDKPPAQVAMKWVLQRPKVASIIVGPRKLEHLRDAMEVSSGWNLTDEEMKRLNQASEGEIPYPYDISRSMNNQRMGLKESTY